MKRLIFTLTLLGSIPSYSAPEVAKFNLNFGIETCAPYGNDMVLCDVDSSGDLDIEVPLYPESQALFGYHEVTRENNNFHFKVELYVSKSADAGYCINPVAEAYDKRDSASRKGGNMGYVCAPTLEALNLISMPGPIFHERENSTGMSITLKASKKELLRP